LTQNYKEKTATVFPELRAFTDCKKKKKGKIGNSQEERLDQSHASKKEKVDAPTLQGHLIRTDARQT